jgi:hypothetical protein
MAGSHGLFIALDPLSEVELSLLTSVNNGRMSDTAHRNALRLLMSQRFQLLTGVQAEWRRRIHRL